VSKPDSVIDFIAATVQEFDVVSIVEVVAGPGGPKAVAKLVDALNRKGHKWDYTISEPTSGKAGSERYACLWKTARVKKKGEAFLEKKYEALIGREPYYITFSHEEKEFTISAFHAVPKSKQPETEIKYLKFLPQEHPDKNFIFCGDFNCPESNSVFQPLKSNHFSPALKCQKTTLKNECVTDNCLASEYDNFFYNEQKIKFIQSGAIHFYKHFPDMKRARKISDHLPVYFEFSLN
jgi:deoxyribonuclease-1-like protein